ncbi:MAG: AbrB/MazE/SpoVT family DNA-binding domain-containing protein [Candidatus Dormibacteraceae bacterium]
MKEKARKRRPGQTRLTKKLQLTLPKAAAIGAELGPGDELKVVEVGRGKVLLTRVDNDPVTKYAGMFKGMYPPDYLDNLRAEWE